jgi:3-hydroxyacyl-[acyl-carrier-protein] dehydratase
VTSGGGEGFRLLSLARVAGDAGGGGPAVGLTAGGIVRAEFEVSAGSPLFDGHFPGQPILPAIAHLALVRRILGELEERRSGDQEPPGGGAEIVAVRNLRLRLPVRPGDILTAQLAAHGGGHRRFELRRGAELVSHGEVHTGEAAPAPQPDGHPPRRDAPPPDPPSPEGDGFPPTAALLPHAPPARLLSAVLWADAARIVCSATVAPCHPLAAGGTAPGFLGLEIGAQAAACLQALGRPAGGAPPIGYLVGVRQAELAPRFPCGATLQVSASLTGGAAALAIYDVEVRQSTDGAGRAGAAPRELLAAATLSTFLLASG